MTGARGAAATALHAPPNLHHSHHHHHTAPKSRRWQLRHVLRPLWARRRALLLFGALPLALTMALLALDASQVGRLRAEDTVPASHDLAGIADVAHKLRKQKVGGRVWVGGGARRGAAIGRGPLQLAIPAPDFIRQSRLRKRNRGPHLGISSRCLSS